MIDPCRLSVNGFSEFLLVHLHNKWMSLDPVWLEALAFFLLVAVILPLILELIDQPVDSSFFPPPEGSGTGQSCQSLLKKLQERGRLATVSPVDALSNPAYGALSAKVPNGSIAQGFVEQVSDEETVRFRRYAFNQ